MKSLNLPKKYAEQFIYRIIKNRSKSFFDEGINLYMQSEQIPLYDSKITMNKELLSDGLNKVNIDWKIHGDEFKEITNFQIILINFYKSIILVS